MTAQSLQDLKMKFNIPNNCCWGSKLLNTTNSFTHCNSWIWLDKHFIFYDWFILYWELGVNWATVFLNQCCWSGNALFVHMYSRIALYQVDTRGIAGDVLSTPSIRVRYIHTQATQNRINIVSLFPSWLLNVRVVIRVWSEDMQFTGYWNGD